jgi:hypothetical protein
MSYRHEVRRSREREQTQATEKFLESAESWISSLDVFADVLREEMDEEGVL